MNILVRFVLDLVWVLIFVCLGFTLYNWLFSSMHPFIFTLILVMPFAAAITINALVFTSPE